MGERESTGGVYDPIVSGNRRGPQRFGGGSTPRTNAYGAADGPAGRTEHGSYMGGTIQGYGDPTSAFSNEVSYGGDSGYAGSQASESARLAGHFSNRAMPGLVPIKNQDGVLRTGLADAQMAANGDWNSGAQRSLGMLNSMQNQQMMSNARGATGSLAARAANRSMAANAIDDGRVNSQLMGDQLYNQERLAGMQRAAGLGAALTGVENSRQNMLDQGATRQMGMNSQQYQHFKQRELDMWKRQAAGQMSRQGYVDKNRLIGYNAQNAKNLIDRGAERDMITDLIAGASGAASGAGSVIASYGGGGQPALPSAQPRGLAGGYVPGGYAVQYGINGPIGTPPAAPSSITGGYGDYPMTPGGMGYG